MSRKITTLATLIALAAAGLTVAPTVSAAPDHAPVACVNGQLVTEYGGLSYDPTGVTGTGTELDPYVLQGVQIDLVAYKAYPAGVVLMNCPNFHLESVQTYGNLGRIPACVPEGSAQPGEISDYAILVQDSAGFLAENSIIKAGRKAGVLFDNGAGQVRWSDVKFNYGAGVYAKNASVVNLTENWMGFNGYFQMPDNEEVPLPTNPPPQSPPHDYIRLVSAVYVELGANLEAYNNTFYGNNQGVVVDKSRDVTTDTTMNFNTIENSNWWKVSVIPENTMHTADYLRPCTESGNTSWWWIYPNAFQPEAAAFRPIAPNAPDAELDVPLLGGYDYTSDPAHVINARFNFWDKVEGPTEHDVAGAADVKFSLPAPPPYAAMTGAAREHGLQDQVRIAQKTITDLLEEAQQTLP